MYGTVQLHLCSYTRRRHLGEAMQRTAGRGPWLCHIGFATIESSAVGNDRKGRLVRSIWADGTEDRLCESGAVVADATRLHQLGRAGPSEASSDHLAAGVENSRQALVVLTVMLIARLCATSSSPPDCRVQSDSSLSTAPLTLTAQQSQTDTKLTLLTCASSLHLGFCTVAHHAVCAEPATNRQPVAC